MGSRIPNAGADVIHPNCLMPNRARRWADHRYVSRTGRSDSDEPVLVPGDVYRRPEPWLETPHGSPLHQVPNKLLVSGALSDWVVPVLEDAADEIDWISGQIRIDCYTEAEPARGTPPYLSSETREVPRISYYRPSSEADLGSETKFHDGLS